MEDKISELMEKYSDLVEHEKTENCYDLSKEMSGFIQKNEDSLNPHDILNNMPGMEH